MSQSILPFYGLFVPSVSNLNYSVPSHPPRSKSVGSCPPSGPRLLYALNSLQSLYKIKGPRTKSKWKLVSKAAVAPELPGMNGSVSYSLGRIGSIRPQRGHKKLRISLDSTPRAATCKVAGSVKCSISFPAWVIPIFPTPSSLTEPGRTGLLVIIP